MKVPLPKSASLQAASASLLQEYGLSQNVDLASVGFKELLITARTASLTELELYQLQRSTDVGEPLNPRNEAAALSLLLELLGDTQETGRDELLGLVCKECDTAFASATTPSITRSGASQHELKRWFESKGGCTLLFSATFENNLRGLAANRVIPPGAVVLSVSQALLINEDTALKSELGQILQQIPGVTADTIILLWTMVERHDLGSSCAPYWQSLPGDMQTGLSWPEALLAHMQGAPGYDSIVEARQHIRTAYDATCPLIQMLLAAYPDHLQPHFFTWQAYLWATQLWYAYAFEVDFGQAGGVRSCLVPFAGLLNHATWPHIVRFGRLDARDGSLKLRTFRSCKPNEQCLLSYGPLPNLKLLLFYGFMLPGNPHDNLQITLKVQQDLLSDDREAALQRWNLTLDHTLGRQPRISPKLRACLRVLVATEPELRRVASGFDPRQALSDENEMHALHTLGSTLESLKSSFPLAEHAGSLARGHLQEFGKTAVESSSLAESANALTAEKMSRWQDQLAYIRLYLNDQLAIIELCMGRVRQQLAIVMELNSGNSLLTKS